MNDYSTNDPSENTPKDDRDSTRSILDQLLLDSRLYRQSKDYKELLDFVVRLRNFAPFNAMLLQIQKPGLTFAASACDWWERFNRRPKPGARPLLILWPFGPVALVYDVMDTEGDALPQDAASCFFATGKIDEDRMVSFKKLLSRKHIHWRWVDTGDGKAGQIGAGRRSSGVDEATVYEMQINRNHPPATQFASLAHELGHLYLGHLGADSKLKVPKRDELSHAKEELEAESVAFIVCRRNGVQPKSETYLSSFVSEKTSMDDLEIYEIMHAAHQVESLLGLAAHTKLPKPGQHQRSLFD